MRTRLDRLDNRAEVFFFGFLLCALVAYTWGAFQLPMSTPSSVIGPGFFPRWVGVIAVILTAIALLRSVRPALLMPAGEPTDTEPVIPHWRDAGVIFGAMILFLYVGFDFLGAALATFLFTFVVTSVVDAFRPVRNLIYSAVLAGSLYLAFEVFLDTGLPHGQLLAF